MATVYLYLIQRTDQVPGLLWDEYDSAVVAAESEEQAGTVICSSFNAA